MRASFSAILLPAQQCAGPLRPLALRHPVSSALYEPVLSNGVIDVVEANTEMLLLFAVVEVKREST